MPRISDARPDLPVVILGEGVGALDAVRSLARMGVRVYSVHKGLHRASLASRYWRGAFLVPEEDPPLDRYLAVVRRAVEAIGPPVVLMPVGDREAVIAAEAAAAEDRVVAPRQASGLVRLLLNKPRMLALAAHYGLRTPRTVQPASADEAQHRAEEFSFPVILKMADPVQSWKQNFVFRNAQELAMWSAGVPPALFPHLIVQEWIPGEDSDSWVFNGYFGEHYTCIASFTGRKLRQVPAFAGVGSLAVCVRNDELHRLSVRFLEGIGYSGPVDIDYRYDHRDGTYKILDVNPRIGGAFRLGVTADGLDLVRVFYRHMAGQPAPRFVSIEGRKRMIEDDLIVAFRHWRAGRIRLRDWFGSLRGVNEMAYLALDDPAPMIVWATGKFRGAVGRRLRPRGRTHRFRERGTVTELSGK